MVFEAFAKPHYVREYRRLVKYIKRTAASEEEAMERAVGGNYASQGRKQADLILSLAPQGEINILDIGCGSGRLAHVLKDESRISYYGIDVVPDLVEYAKKVSARDDWRFEVVNSLETQCADGWADVIVFMSVFTHLTPEETKTYLKEAYRCARPGGLVIASYLERDFEPHVKAFRSPLMYRIARLLGRDVMLSHTSQQELSAWFEAANLHVENAITEKSPVGHHVLIGRKPV